jgi:hypothetical protein
LTDKSRFDHYELVRREDGIFEKWGSGAMGVAGVDVTDLDTRNKKQSEGKRYVRFLEFLSNRPTPKFNQIVWSSALAATTYRVPMGTRVESSGDGTDRIRHEGPGRVFHLAPLSGMGVQSLLQVTAEHRLAVPRDIAMTNAATDVLGGQVAR